MPEKLVGEGAELGGEVNKMIVIFHPGVWYTEEWLSGDKLKDNATETPDINGIIDGSGEDRLGSSEAEWSNRLFRRIGKEICYSEQRYEYRCSSRRRNR